MTFDDANDYVFVSDGRHVEGMYGQPWRIVRELSDGTSVVEFESPDWNAIVAKLAELRGGKP